MIEFIEISAAYKDIDDVMKESDLVEMIHTL